MLKNDTVCRIWDNTVYNVYCNIKNKPYTLITGKSILLLLRELSMTSENSIIWRGKYTIDYIAKILTVNDNLFTLPKDKTHLTEIINGKIYYRERFIEANEWEAPSNLEESLFPSWKFYYHSLCWLNPVYKYLRNRKNGEYEKFFITTVKAWLEKYGIPPVQLPTQLEPGDYTWYDMSVAWRTIIIISALALHPDDDFFIFYLKNHADALMTEEYYPGIGNHALHMNYALASAALVLNNYQFLKTAFDRIEKLKAISIDNEGVSLEGSASYHLFNMNWWKTLHLQLAKIYKLAIIKNKIIIPDMRSFLKNCIAPDGKIIPLGDSIMTKRAFQGLLKDYPRYFVDYLKKDAELVYALSMGEEGIPFHKTMYVFQDGYWFSRSQIDGLPSTKQSLAFIRFGYGLKERVHAHDDAGSILFYPNGVRILEDGGMYGYYGGKIREFVKSQKAHNTILFSEKKYYRSAYSEIKHAESGLFFDQAEISIKNIQHSVWTRIIAHAKNEKFLFIQDHIRTSSNFFTQLFNLGDGFNIVEILQNRINVEDDNGNKACFFWLCNNVKLDKEYGNENDFIGFRSTYEGEIHPIYTITARFDDIDNNRTDKIIVVILLLDKEDMFTDVQIVSYNLYSNHTKFVLKKNKRILYCDVFFGKEDNPSNIMVLV